MSEIIKKLSALAQDVRAHSYSPYSGFKVGAALVTDSGDIFSGTNVETVTYRGICAEGAAISAMASAGGRKIREIAVIGPTDRGTNILCTPCGDCRQRILEFADAETRVHVLRPDGTLAKTYTMDELLPDSFGPENLKI